MELTAAEEQQILKAREGRRINSAGGYGPAPKLDAQQAALLDALDALNDQRLTMGYGPLPRDLDAETVAAIERVQRLGFAMKTVPHGDARPFAIPSRVAYEIIRALRGEKQAPATGDIPVPSK